MKTKFSGILTLLLAFMVQFTFAQEKTVSGTVTDESGPLPGVSVVIKGTTTGTETDFDGKYSIITNSGDVLRFSFVGMATKNITVGASNTIDVVMKTDNVLEEVVVTAQGIRQNRKKLTYATQQVKEEELNVTQSTDIRQALAGKIAGAQISSQAGSKLGETGELYLRGAISLTGRGGAIYIVDGTVTRPDNVDLENIGSINVLKGPNATAIYGLRGANGVVVITTKSGKKGRLNVDIYNSTTFENVAYLPDYQNEYGQGYDGEAEWATFNYAAGANGGAWGAYPTYFEPLDGVRFNQTPYADESWGPKFDGQPYAPWYSWFPGTTESPNPYYGKTAAWSAQKDNIKDAYDTGISTKTGFTIRGGTEKFTGRLGYTRQDQSGLIPQSSRKVDLFSAKFDVDLSEKLSMGATANFSKSETDGFFDDSYGNQVSGSFNSWFGREIDISKLKELKNLVTPDGFATSWNWWGPDIYSLSHNFGSRENGYLKPTFWYNPYFFLDEFKTGRKRNNLVGDIHASYAFNDNYKLSIIASRNSYNRKDNFFVPYSLEFSSAPARFSNWVNSFGQTKRSFEENTIRPTLELNFDLSEDFDFSSTIGYEYRSAKFDFFSANMNQTGHPSVGDAVGLVIPDLFTFSNSRQRVNPTYFERDYRVNSLFGRFAVSYKGYLTINADVNNTWDSRYDIVGNDNTNSFLYGSLGATLTFSEFMENKDVLNFGKIYASYARVGTEINAFLLNPGYGLSSRTFNSNPLMFTPGDAIDPNVKPATSGSLEIGAELNFLQNKIRFAATYYNEDREDEIIRLQLPSSTGNNSLVTNSGLVNRTGIEITLGLTPVRTESFKWDMNINFAKTKTVVKSIADGLESIVPTNTTANEFNSQFSFVTLTNRVGEDWGQLVGAGINRDASGNPILNADGTVTSTPGQSLGSVLPDFTGGVYNTFSYKNFTLTGTLTFQKGGKFFSLSESWGGYSGLTAESAGLNDKGNPKRDAPANGGGVHSIGVDENGATIDTYVPAADYYKSFFGNRVAEQFIHDASYLKLSELSLNYSLPKKLIGKVLESASLGIVARNVAILSVSKENVHGWDPSEFSKPYGENGQLPGTRSIGFNLKFTF